MCSVTVGIEKISINGWCSQRGHSASEDVQVQEAEAEEGVVCEQESNTDVFAVLYLGNSFYVGGRGTAQLTLQEFGERSKQVK